MQKAQSYLNIFHFGPGNVGKAFLRILLPQRKFIFSKYGINIIISGIFKSDKYIFRSGGLIEKEIERVCNNSKNQKWTIMINNSKIWQLIKTNSNNSVLIDTTASENTFNLILKKLRAGGSVVVSNKKNLTSDYSQYKKLLPFMNNFFYETTVGAGLPVISTIKDMIETGDEIEEVMGCFSGTLGFIFSKLEKGSSFSQDVLTAKNLGFTEPDPRDDLSGADVARKVLILARLLGKKISLSDIKIQPLYPESMKKYTVDEFISQLHSLDSTYNKQITKVLKERKTLRYVAVVRKNKTEVALKEVPLSNDIGSLKGPDNIITIRSSRYNKNPMIIKGPGAGIDVTAAGVFADLLKILRMIRAK